MTHKKTCEELDQEINTEKMKLNELIDNNASLPELAGINNKISDLILEYQKAKTGDSLSG